MQTLESDAEIGPDGSVKLLSPLPAWLKPGRAHVVLTFEPSVSVPKAPQPGTLKGFTMTPDFDEPLEDFRDYTE